ncbi:MAG: hypothetical protein RTU92_09575 [Candidatus Thorarchaeota archaeon]
MMPDQRLVAAVLVVLVLGGVGVLSYSLNALTLGSGHLPPATTAPGPDSEVITDGDVELWADSEFWQDFMPAVPPEGPPFYAVVGINITNNGDTKIVNIGVAQATVFFYDTGQPLASLNMTTVNYYFAPIEIGPGESIYIEYINSRSEIYSPTLEEDTMLYARVLFVWGDGNQQILTTPPAALLFTF